MNEKEFINWFNKVANPILTIDDDYIDFSLNNRIILDLTWINKQDLNEALTIIYNHFDFSYYLDFETLDEVKEYFNYNQ